MKLFKGQEAAKKKSWRIVARFATVTQSKLYQRLLHFLDEITRSLVGVLKVWSLEALDNLPQSEVMQKWWQYMGDIMESNPDNLPVSIPLKEVFYLP